jgi:hypothetical protein
LVGFEGFTECTLQITKIEMVCLKRFRSKTFKTYQRPLIDKMSKLVIIDITFVICLCGKC